MRLPRTPPSFDDITQDLIKDPQRVQRLLLSTVGTTANGKYRHWDILRHLEPPFPDLTPKEWWFGIKLARRQNQKQLPLRDSLGVPFTFQLPDQLQERLHTIDQRASGEIAISEQIVNTDMRRRYVVSSLIEEAITSSQLEGAMTTKRVAKEMIRSGRPPRDKSEQMILNNYQAMSFISEIKAEALTPALVCRVHEIVTRETLDNADDAGRLQRPGDHRVEVVDFENNLLHCPPPSDQLEERLVAMCSFANSDSGPTGFLHPVVRAIILHFWLAYDHPFVDGNGRTARALFYWSMLKQGYWLAEFLSISRILASAPAKYGRSFLYCETDENDTTYFIDYQLDVICRAIEGLHTYLIKKMSEVRDAESLIRNSADFNYRQLALLSHSLRHPDGIYTFRSHSLSHNVVLQSGRTDLLGLEDRGLLERRKRGREFVFSPPRDLAQRLKEV